MIRTIGEWGKLPGPSDVAKKGFKNFWEADTKVFLAQNTNRKGGYKFEETKAKPMKYTHASADTQDICVFFDDEIPSGKSWQNLLF